MRTSHVAAFLRDYAVRIDELCAMHGAKKCLAKRES
jgi:hypothetical protein